MTIIKQKIEKSGNIHGHILTAIIFLVMFLLFCFLGGVFRNEVLGIQLFLVHT